MSERIIKTGWHLLMVAAAITEFKHAKTPFRKGVVGGFGGFHLAMAVMDWQDTETEDIQKGDRANK